jgi:hypothetical protein
MFRLLINLDYSRAKPPSLPNFNVDKDMAHEAVAYYRDWASTRPLL